MNWANLPEEFVSDFTLLAFAALVTGFMIPFILKRRDEAKAALQRVEDDKRLRDQKVFEEDLVRGRKVIEAQSALLDEIAKQLWKFRYLAMAVSLYDPAKHSSRSAQVTKEYDEQSWEVFNSFRILVSKSRWLISEQAYNELDSFYHDILVEFDAKAVRSVAYEKIGYQLLNDFILHVFSKEVDRLLSNLASELKLTSAESTGYRASEEIGYKDQYKKLLEDMRKQKNHILMKA